MRVPHQRLCLSAVAALIVGATALTLFLPPLRAEDPAGRDQKQWAAVAPGRIESKSREIKIVAPLIGRMTEVLVKPNDKVFAGEVLIRLDDDEAVARLASAEAQVALRKRARDDTSAPRGSASRRKAEDALADAERALVDARAALDKAAADRRHAGGPEDSVNAARAAFTRAQDRLAQQRAELRRIKSDSDTPLPNRTEGELNISRAELAAAELAVEKTRIRAPIAGTVLQVQAKPGEMATPSPEQTLLVLADLSALRVRAELDERDISRIHVGQVVVVRTAAFKDREFAGKVASIAQMVGPAVMNARGQRKLNDIDVVDVVIDLTDPGLLTVGMQVEVYFRADGK